MKTQRPALIALVAAALLLLVVWRLSTGPEPAGCTAQADEADVGGARAKHKLDGSAASAPADERSTRERIDAPTSAVVDAALPDESLEIRGRVVDSNEVPVVDARVALLSRPAQTLEFLNDDEYYREEREIEFTRSNAAGEFAFEVTNAGVFALSARADGFALARAANVMTGQFVVVHALHAASLRGNVTRRVDHSPIAGARVLVRRDDTPAPVFEGATNESGAYRIDGLTPGSIMLQVIPEDALHQNVELELREGEAKIADVDVDAGLCASGQVRDRATGLPIANAEVSSWSFLNKITRTGADGRYSQCGLQTRFVVTLSARARGYARSDVATRVDGRESLSVDIELDRGRTIRGRVVRRDGAPIASAYAAAVGVSNAAHQVDTVSARTGADGRFELKDVRPDLRHMLLVRKDGFASEQTPLPPTQGASPEHDVGDVVLPIAASVAGIVVDSNGKLLDGCEITCSRVDADPIVAASVTNVRQAETDARGRFHIGDLEPGKYRMRFDVKGYRALENVEVELVEGQVRRDLRVVMDAGLSIEGRVLDPFGNALEGASAWVSNAGVDERVHATSDADGRFKLASLARGVHTLHAVHEPIDVGGQRIELAQANVSGIAAGTTDVSIQLARVSTIEGVAQDASGASVAHIGVVARDAQGETVDSAFTDVSGRFRLRVAEKTTVDLFVFPTQPEPQALSGYTMLASAEPRAVLRGVQAGAHDVSVRVEK
jgi:protocatechuate 3,4-dioxygenase beta subunit